MAQDEIFSLLRRTAELLVSCLYLNRATVPSLEALWTKLSQTGQRSIIGAQLYLLNAADHYVRQLGGGRHPIMRDNLAKWDSSRRYKADSEQYPEQKDALIQKSEELEREAKDELKRLLIENNEVHEILVDAVRRKMRQYQYHVNSIPFELFQNADDAYQELTDMVGTTELEDSIATTKFVITVTEGTIRFAHWGRCINEYDRYDRFEKGREYGFDRDLEKMLTLYFSDKEVRDINVSNDLCGSVTGKFGLGFKSIYLATSSPSVVSGRLCFYTRGGFFPLTS